MRQEFVCYDKEGQPFIVVARTFRGIEAAIELAIPVAFVYGMWWLFFST